MSRQEVGAGLNNLGNSCFANSVLQLILHEPIIIAALQRHGNESKMMQMSFSDEYCQFGSTRSIITINVVLVVHITSLLHYFLCSIVRQIIDKVMQE